MKTGRFLIVAFGLCSCSQEQSLVQYETTGQMDSLYLSGQSFIFHRSMEESKGLEEFLSDGMTPVSTDKSGCLLIDPLILPSDIHNPTCDDTSFTSKSEGQNIILHGSCSNRGQMCQMQRYNENGELLEFQFSPEDSLSDRYVHVSGKRLKNDGSL